MWTHPSEHNLGWSFPKINTWSCGHIRWAGLGALERNASGPVGNFVDNSKEIDPGKKGTLHPCWHCHESIPGRPQLHKPNLRVSFVQNKDHVAPEGSRPPLLVKVHGGPTSSCRQDLNLKLQYFTSRGFALLDVNYRGSTSYGKPFRHRLRDKSVAQSCLSWKLSRPVSLLHPFHRSVLKVSVNRLLCHCCFI